MASMWAGPTGRDLMLAVNEGLEAAGLSHRERNAVRDVCTRLTHRGPWRKYSAETLRQSYYKARRHHGGDSKQQRGKMPDIDYLALLNLWLAAIKQIRRVPDKRRITRDKANIFIEFALKEIKNGNWPSTMRKRIPGRPPVWEFYWTGFSREEIEQLIKEGVQWQN